MPSQTTSPPLTVTVLAALWVSVGRCGVSVSPGPGCDNGKLSLDRDLSADAAHWSCPGSPWPQRLPSSVDTVYDPEPARQICMDKSISYNQTIPSSGAYRSVRAESGEYLYCPPQRWLNNLHHGATVLLYHPCAPLHERRLLSALARSCLPDYIVTSHPQLHEHRPIALVSWGHTLELSTVASSDVCDWLKTKTSTRNTFGGVSRSRKYNLLLTWSAEQQRARPEEHSAKVKESVRRCCEQTMSSLLNGAMEAEREPNMKKESLKEEGKHRRIRRAAIKEQHESVKDERENTITHQTSSSIGDVQNYTPGPSAGSPVGNRTVSDPPGPRGGLTPRPTTPLGSNGFRAPESQNSGLQTAAQHTDLRNPPAGSHGVNGEHNDTARPEALGLSSKGEGTDSTKERDTDSRSVKGKHSDKNKTADNGSVKDNEVVDVKERELEHKKTHSDTHSHHKSEKPQHKDPQPASDLPDSRDCDGCQQDAEASAAVGNNGLPRTPRTDEAVWAAAALGFLLILLTLSVLHTRLYRHWRTTPSLYWHDPQRDYDSVADVIRRRLRIANRRRKRGRRRQECVLLPSSSSSDEHP